MDFLKNLLACIVEFKDVKGYLFGRFIGQSLATLNYSTTEEVCFVLARLSVLCCELADQVEAVQASRVDFLGALLLEIVEKVRLNLESRYNSV